MYTMCDRIQLSYPYANLQIGLRYSQLMSKDGFRVGMFSVEANLVPKEAEFCVTLLLRLVIKS